MAFLVFIFNKGKLSRYTAFSKWNSRFVKSKTSVAILGPKMCLEKVLLFGHLQHSEDITK
jgi:hypothetical protein